MAKKKSPNSEPNLRSVFVTIANPEWYFKYAADETTVIDKTPSKYNGLSPQEICDQVIKDWTDSGNGRYGACTYCISADGFEHCHAVFECDRDHKFSFNGVKKVFPKAHIEITHGTKEEAQDYIEKRGKYEEKGEKVLCISQNGELQGKQGNRSDLSGYQDMLDDGYTPDEILGSNIKAYRYETMIRSAYMKKRYNETPSFRNVDVTWHSGSSGSGKSYTCEKLIKEYGRSNIYRITKNIEKGKFDTYIGQKILFIDDLDPTVTDFRDLLVVLDNYTTEISARYRNVYSLWEQVHITSIYTPEQFYKECVPVNRQLKDPQIQLIRRINRDFSLC